MHICTDIYMYIYSYSLRAIPHLMEIVLDGMVWYRMVSYGMVCPTPPARRLSDLLADVHVNQPFPLVVVLDRLL